eukprot:1724751-Pyramimonas_sp.AAC.2
MPARGRSVARSSATPPCRPSRTARSVGSGATRFARRPGASSSPSCRNVCCAIFVRLLMGAAPSPVQDIRRGVEGISARVSVGTGLA